MIIKNGNIITADSVQYNTNIVVEDGIIADIGQKQASSQTIDASGLFVAPGFVDIHTHGGYGGDFMDVDVESFNKALDFHTEFGTTSILATSVTAPVSQIENMLSVVRKFKDQDNGKCRILGAHIEGPYLSHKNKGAQHESFLRIPSRDSYDFIIRNADVIKTVTIAPELDGALEMTKTLKKEGITVCGGHDDGERKQIVPVIDAGLSHCTHLWCAMSGVAMRDGVRDIGLFELGLIDDRLSVEIIADNHHITPEMVRLVHRCKADKMCIVSDSLRAGGMPPDNDVLYILGSREDENAQKFIASHGVARLPDGSRYAGSIQPLNQMLKNLVFDAKIPLVDAVNSASLNPARVIGVDKEIGSIEVGKRADLCIMDSELNVKAVIINGKLVKGDLIA